ncbi:helix-turn-helix domain-containing protein [Tissierella sp. MSJ-40]|uniref:Helix-turn-helix domain-containing protein n=1 Tax=Tissierella simiarum TaxID=2841534 RepID=A0ABS6E955_9FIRM|nr:helix-turn-helix transcriptional regulator [Tissierella simiarum]MBU5439457.1 helix-turn-helix domain-containing protein [Tissierella simiarum]
MSSLGNSIKELRQRYGMTIKELSDKSGVGQSTISEIETGKAKNPKSETLSKLASVLNVTIDELMADKWDDQYNENGKLSEQIKRIESLEFLTPEDALKFILEQPALMAYGGYDLDKMTDDEIMGLANDMLFAMKLSIEKMKRK